MFADYNLSGSLPAELWNLTGMEFLTITNEPDLQWSIPPEIGNLTTLTAIDMYDNAFIGTIPSELWNLTWLSALNFNANNLYGWAMC